MITPAVQPLSPQDQTFLPYETPTTPMHISWIWTFESGLLATESGGIDVARIRRAIGRRLDRLPRLRQRLAFSGLGAAPCWVDDDRFDLDAHVRHLRLPDPGGVDELRKAAGWIVARPLRRSRPLWEMWVIEGVAAGRFATVAKFHHALADGVSTVEVMAKLFEPGEGRTPRKRQPHARGADRKAAFRATLRTMQAGVTLAPATPFNAPIGARRRIGWLAVDLDSCRAVKERLGGTVNDVVLAAVAGAVRASLAASGVDVDRLRDFRTVVPVDVRSAEERGTLGNRASAWIVRLPVDEPEAARRLERVRRETADHKGSELARGGDSLNRLAGLFGYPLTVLGVRVLSTFLRPYNLIVTNIPGPERELRLCGARLEEAYPQVPLFSRQGLGIALSSYRGRLGIGLSADPDAGPDLADFAALLQRSFAELDDAARARSAA